MTRIGITGVENSHVDHFIRFLNREGRHPGTRITALAGGEPERRQKLAADGDIDVLVESSADLVGSIDGLIVSSRDGRLHLEQALPVIEAGLPVLVDKPLAASTRDAKILIDAARSNAAPLLSSSALRHVSEIQALHEGATSRGQTQQISIIGPADPGSEYAGLWFYGIHVVEAALELSGDGDFTTVTVQRTENTIIATTTVNGINIVLTFVTPDSDGQVPFHATVIGRHTIDQSLLTLGPDYNAPVLDLFIETVKTGTAPIPYDTLLRPVRLLESITDQL